MLIGWPEGGGMMSTTREEGKSALVGRREVISDLRPPVRGGMGEGTEVKG